MTKCNTFDKITIVVCNNFVTIEETSEKYINNGGVLMNLRCMKIAAGCLAGVVVAGGYTVGFGATELATDMPTAGIAVALDQYYAESDDVQADVRAIINPIVGNNDVETETTAPAETQAETPAAEQPTEAATEPETTMYDTIAISQVDNYVNVRSAASTESEVVGKIYNNCAATIVENDGEWYKIKSGNVEGYINAQYFVTGEAAKQKAVEIGKVFATVTTTTLNVREGQGTETKLLTQLPEGGVFDVEEYGDGWVLLNVDEDAKGWVSQDYVDISVKFDTAVTLEEEQAMLAEQQRLAEEAAKAEEAAREAQAKADADRAAKAAADRAAAAAAAAQQEEQNNVSSDEDTGSSDDNYYDDSNSSSTASPTRDAVVAYARQFEGNPYVYGGSSLTNGTDCSGFTMSVYAHFGVGLPHSSSAQSGCGVAVSLDSLQPGDLLFYSNGGSGIGHVALYIGGGQIIHASTSNTGIIVSNAFYRTPVAARRVIY